MTEPDEDQNPNEPEPESGGVEGGVSINDPDETGEENPD